MLRLMVHVDLPAASVCYKRNKYAVSRAYIKDTLQFTIRDAPCMCSYDKNHNYIPTPFLISSPAS